MDDLLDTRVGVLQQSVSSRCFLQLDRPGTNGILMRRYVIILGIDIKWHVRPATTPSPSRRWKSFIVIDSRPVVESFLRSPKRFSPHEVGADGSPNGSWQDETPPRVTTIGFVSLRHGRVGISQERERCSSARQEYRAERTRLVAVQTVEEATRGARSAGDVQCLKHCTRSVLHGSRSTKDPLVG
jgi:hypothetical protein